MPYITKDDREKYNIHIRTLNNEIDRLNPYDISGHLNYIITKLLINTNPKKYYEYNTLIGVLESAKLELYRRKIAPYENLKCELNGDVY